MTDTAPPADVPPPPSPPPVPQSPWNAEWAVGFGWRTMKAHPESILVLFVGMLLSVVVSLPGSIYETVDSMRHGGHASTEVQLLRWSLEALNFPISVYFGMGMTRYALNLCRGEKNGFGDLFVGGPYLSFLGATILTMLGIAGGMVLCIVPGVILILGWSFVRPLILDRAVGALDSMKESWRLTTGHKVQLLVLLLFSIGIAVVGVCACGVGVLVAMPVITFANIAVYLRLTGQNIADPK